MSFYSLFGRVGTLLVPPRKRDQTRIISTTFFFLLINIGIGQSCIAVALNDFILCIYIQPDINTPYILILAYIVFLKYKQSENP